MERIQKGTGHMQELITDLFSLSRITLHVSLFKIINMNERAAEALEDLELAIQEEQAIMEINHFV